MPDIVELNQLVATEEGIFTLPGRPDEPFAYSDGESVERYLHDVFSAATDLSSRSEALQAAIIDWPTEYHLTSDRSNLLRPYDLAGVESVLELGSGCGAISRYLGELGKRVDAVEGSAVRAGLGRMRCRDLDNVRVINANYNELTIPEGHYDLVLFVGVIEYARRFVGDDADAGAGSDRDAAITILRRAGGYLAPRGAVLVAIENRLGLKYQQGAHEDHYAKKYIGINGYRDSAGIATYSRDEWVGIIQEAGFGGSAFAYPFPDYKVPRVVLGDRYLWNNPHAGNHLEGLVSRDYYAPMPRDEREAIGWQAACEGGYLRLVANSFSILMGPDNDALRKLQNFDFCHAPGPGRRNRFAVTTIKPMDEDTVLKRAACPDSQPEADRDGPRQVLQPEPFIAGDLLAGQWLRSILIHVRRAEFEQELRDYYAFLGDREAAGQLAIDLLPINILVTEDGSWREFDQEWVVDGPLGRDYLLFRALLTFVVTHWPRIRDFLGWLELRNVQDFVEWGFHVNGVHLSEHLEDFVARENHFQRAISPGGRGVDVDALLGTVFDFSDGAETLFSAVYWRDSEDGWAEDRKATSERVSDPGLVLSRFALEGAGAVSRIRFDPFDLRRPADTGFFRVDTVALVAVGENGERELWRIKGEEAIMTAAGATSATVAAEGGMVRWIALTDFPKLTFDLGSPCRAGAGETLRVDIRWGVVRTAEYALAYNHCLVESTAKDKAVERSRRNLTAMKMVADYERKRLEDEAATYRRQSENMQSEIDHIKASRAFRLGSGLIGLVHLPGRFIRWMAK